jgi:hypothetical protein
MIVIVLPLPLVVIECREKVKPKSTQKILRYDELAGFQSSPAKIENVLNHRQQLKQRMHDE